MKRYARLIGFLAVIMVLTGTDAMAVYTSSDIIPANAYSDPADYALILKDNDGWELRMNPVQETGSTRRYKGILIYEYGGSVYVGDLKAVYYRDKGVLLLSCKDTGWHNYTLSYTLQKFDGNTYLDQTWQLSGVYLYYETGTGNTIGVDIVKGSLK